MSLLNKPFKSSYQGLNLVDHPKKRKKRNYANYNMLQTINYLNINGTKKHKMNNKNQHVWKKWSKKKIART